MAKPHFKKRQGLLLAALSLLYLPSPRPSKCVRPFLISSDQCSSPGFAGALSFHITIHGRGGHAAMPHGNIDPIVAAGAVITGLQVRVFVCVDHNQCRDISTALPAPQLPEEGGTQKSGCNLLGRGCGLVVVVQASHSERCEAMPCAVLTLTTPSQLTPLVLVSTVTHYSRSPWCPVRRRPWTRVWSASLFSKGGTAPTTSSPTTCSSGAPSGVR